MYILTRQYSGEYAEFMHKADSRMDVLVVKGFKAVACVRWYVRKKELRVSMGLSAKLNQG